MDCTGLSGPIDFGESLGQALRLSHAYSDVNTPSSIVSYSRH